MGHYGLIREHGKPVEHPLGIMIMFLQMQIYLKVSMLEERLISGITLMLIMD